MKPAITIIVALILGFVALNILGGILKFVLVAAIGIAAVLFLVRQLG